MKNLIFSPVAIFVATIFFALCSAGCPKLNPGAPINEEVDTTRNKAAQRLEFVSLSTSSVGLRWEAAESAVVTGYEVRWIATGNSSDRGSVAVNGLSVVIDDLNFRQYNFFVYSIVNGSIYEDYYDYAIGAWAPAERLTTSSAPIRIYEPDSEYGNGLIVDPNRGGPRRVRIEPGVEAQFALTIVEGGPSHPPLEAHFGAAWGSNEYYSEGRSDLDVSIATGDVFRGTSLDEWYIKANFDFHTTLYRNFSQTYELSSLDAADPNTQHKGILFRLGDRNIVGHHFGRILIYGGSDELHLKGIAPNRYIEVEISYGGENIPFA